MEVVALRLMLEYGTVPALLLLVVVIVLFKKEIISRLDEMKNEMDDLRNRINYVEKEYVTRKEHYADTSGWRSELKAIGERIDKMMVEVLKK